ncbi:hypothetical protein OCJ37_17830 [Xanthomonas sp. AM6]|uniref:hypothetical protein n=1 Tax=Xanthomonas sp. AM6 TaxID=2982531 RepID=UPI0021D897CC|nr:hypothetical protein [Xanthomonas sp. AM6]UYB51807.1 hypothetical protein OCJ37_17830 [Xanthomonas sp. AM6]
MRETLLCPDLQRVLDRELAQGNRLHERPHRTDWPHPGSVFASLTHDLRSAPGDLPAAVRHAVCRDPHYGWHDECYCEIHQHLLVAGATKPP